MGWPPLHRAATAALATPVDGGLGVQPPVSNALNGRLVIGIAVAGVSLPAARASGAPNQPVAMNSARTVPTVTILRRQAAPRWAVTLDCAADGARNIVDPPKWSVIAPEPR